VDESSAEDLLERITGLLRDDYGAYFSTVQVERSCVGEQPSEIDFLQTLPAGDEPDPTAGPGQPTSRGPREPRGPLEPRI
jgi:hypothetical protein